VLSKFDIEDNLTSLRNYCFAIVSPAMTQSHTTLLNKAKHIQSSMATFRK
jgi:hypothetical protein